MKSVGLLIDYSNQQNSFPTSVICEFVNWRCDYSMKLYK